MDRRKQNISGKSWFKSDIQSCDPFVAFNLFKTLKYFISPSNHHLLFYHLKWVSYNICDYLGTNRCCHIPKMGFIAICPHCFISIKERERVRKRHNHLAWESSKFRQCNWFEILFGWRCHYSRFNSFERIEYHIDGNSSKTSCNTMPNISHY